MITKSILQHTRFKKDYKIVGKRIGPKVLSELVKAVVLKLVTNTPLEPKYNDHQLIGNWKGYRDVHIKPDLILIYKATETEVILVRIGSHADLF